MSTVIQFPDMGPEPLTQQVSSEVKALMGRYGVSQMRLAAWLGISQPAVSSRLRGSTQWTVPDIERVARGFAVHPAVLMGGYATSPRPGGPGEGLPILLPRLDSNQEPSDSRYPQVSALRCPLHESIGDAA